MYPIDGIICDNMDFTVLVIRTKGKKRKDTGKKRKDKIDALKIYVRVQTKQTHKQPER